MKTSGVVVGLAVGLCAGLCAAAASAGPLGETTHETVVCSTKAELDVASVTMNDKQLQSLACVRVRAGVRFEIIPPSKYGNEPSVHAMFTLPDRILRAWVNGYFVKLIKP